MLKNCLWSIKLGSMYLSIQSRVDIDDESFISEGHIPPLPNSGWVYEDDVEEELGESMAVIIHSTKTAVGICCNIPNISCILIHIRLALIKLITD